MLQRTKSFILETVQSVTDKLFASNNSLNRIEFPIFGIQKRRSGGHQKLFNQYNGSSLK